MAINPVSIKGPDGRQGYAMRCSGSGRSLEACYQKAGELCSTGYDIVDNASAAVAASINGNFALGQKRSLVIECR